MGRRKVIDIEEGLAFASAASVFLTKAVEAGTSHYRSKLVDAVARINILYPEIVRLYRLVDNYSKDLNEVRSRNSDLHRENAALAKMIRDNLKEEI